MNLVDRLHQLNAAFSAEGLLCGIVNDQLVELYSNSTMHAYGLSKDDIRPGIREANPFQRIRNECSTRYVDGRFCPVYSVLWGSIGLKFSLLSKAVAISAVYSFLLRDRKGLSSDTETVKALHVKALSYLIITLCSLSHTKW